MGAYCDELHFNIDFFEVGVVFQPFVVQSLDLVIVPPIFYVTFEGTGDPILG